MEFKRSEDNHERLSARKTRQVNQRSWCQGYRSWRDAIDKLGPGRHYGNMSVPTNFTPSNGIHPVCQRSLRTTCREWVVIWQITGQLAYRNVPVWCLPIQVFGAAIERSSSRVNNTLSVVSTSIMSDLIWLLVLI